MSGICECGHEQEDHGPKGLWCEFCPCVKYKTETQLVDIFVDKETVIQIPENMAHAEWETVAQVDKAPAEGMLMIINPEGQVAGFISIDVLQEVAIGKRAHAPVIRTIDENPVSI